MTPTVPPTPEPSPAPEEPQPNAVVRAAISGVLALLVWPEPVTGFLGGGLVSVGKTLVNRWRTAPPSRPSLAAAAKRRYRIALDVIDQSGLRGFELSSARAAAKQQYLRELSEALK